MRRFPRYSDAAAALAFLRARTAGAEPSHGLAARAVIDRALAAPGSSRLFGAALAGVVVVAVLPSVAVAPVAPDDVRPAAVWQSALQTATRLAPDVTVRNLATVSVGGSGVRVRLGNPYGVTPVEVRTAWVGRAAAPGAARILPGSHRRLTFGGAARVSIEPGGHVLSDPAALTVRFGQALAVSVYAPGAPINEHSFPPHPADPPGSFISTGGDHAAEESDVGFRPAGGPPVFLPGLTWWLDLIVLDRPEAAGTIVALGDSITDGFAADGAPGHRWTDVLATRMDDVPADERLAVANAGISGNLVSLPPNPTDATGRCCGAPALARLDRDVLDVPGIRYLLVTEGTNDIGVAAAPAERVIEALRQIAERAHARGVKVVVGTLLPMCKPVGSVEETTRQTVNGWIRSAPVFDAVVDFDALLRDPADPTQMLTRLRADCYHPNAAGGALVGDAVPLAVFGIDRQ